VPPSERESHESLGALLAMPCCAPIGPALRQALLDAAPAEEAPRDPFGVIAETLSALSMLESEGDVLAAAILHVMPRLRERLEPRLAREFAAVGIMLEGQRAATQVWALHAERSTSGSSEGLRRLLLFSGAAYVRVRWRAPDGSAQAHRRVCRRQQDGQAMPCGRGSGGCGRSQCVLTPQ